MRFWIATVAIILSSLAIIDISQEGQEKKEEGFGYDDPEIRVTSLNQSIHSVPNVEIVGGIEVTLPCQRESGS